MGSKSKSEGVLVEFFLSPTGKFGLAYSEGDRAEFSKEKAAELVDAGFAKIVDLEEEAAAAKAEEEAKAAAAKAAAESK